jgi:hypothetical protein
MLPSLPLRGVRLRLRLFLLCSLVAGAARAQSDPIKFGQIEKADLTAAPFAADSAAEAVVLCDFGRSRLRGKGAGFQVIFERITRVKILKKSGYDEATVEIPLYHREGDREEVTGLRGFTYNLVNGVVEKTPLESSGAFIEKRTPNLDVQKFTLPNVREGAVIEYAYTLKSDFLFNFQDWTFERAIPVRWSEYRVSIPSFYRYKIIYQSNKPFFINKSGLGSVNLTIDNKTPSNAGLSGGQVHGTLSISAPTEEHQWVLKDVPAFRREPYMTTPQDYVSRLDFELTGEQWPESPYHDLTGSWDKINTRLLNDDEFGGRIERPDFLKAQLQVLAAQYPEVAARIAAVRQLVMAAVRYDGTNRYFARAPLRKAFELHRGSSADVNLLLIGALREVGLVAHPLLLSTRDHGHLSREFPLIERFNYVVALVPLADGKDLLVDATEPLLPCGTLPERCLNGAGRLISKVPTESRWVDLAPAQRHVRFQQVRLALDAQGGLSGKVHEEHGGYAAADTRGTLLAQGEKKYLNDVQRRHESWALPKLTVGAAENIEKPLTLDYEFAQPAEEQTAKSTLYLSPLSDFGIGQNPFRRESRAFEIDFGMAHDETLLINLALPAGYELAEVPKPTILDLPDGGGRFSYSVAVPGTGVVMLTSRLTLYKTLYPAEQYAYLRELYRYALEKQGQKLIIRKKA